MMSCWNMEAQYRLWRWRPGAAAAAGCSKSSGPKALCGGCAERFLIFVFAHWLGQVKFLLGLLCLNSGVTWTIELLVRELLTQRYSLLMVVQIALYDRVCAYEALEEL